MESTIIVLLRRSDATIPYAEMIRPLPAASLPTLLVLAILLAGCAGGPAHERPRCQGSCSTHTEGYEWAQRGDYEDPAVCEGHAPAFVEGCRDGIEDRSQMRRATRGI